jgi:hypothetical protein
MAAVARNDNYAMKIMLAVSIAGLLGVPILAETTIPQMPWYAQFGLCGLFGGLLFYAMSKLIPQISADSKEAAIRVAAENKAAMVESAALNAEALERVANGQEGIRAEIRAGNDAQLALLRTMVQQGRSPHGS